MPKHERHVSHPLVTLTRVWFDCALEASLLGHSLSRGTVALRELRSLRGRWFSSLAEVADRSMRTAGFLELMGITLHTISAPSHLGPRGATRLEIARGGGSGASR